MYRSHYTAEQGTLAQLKIRRNSDYLQNAFIKTEIGVSKK